jgi:predicted DsbA family dithiol-disulfide isomerase
MAKIDASRPRFNQMMQDEHGIAIDAGPFGISSRNALVAAKWAEAQSQDAGHAFHDIVFRAYWMDSQNIEDVAVLRACAEQAGLEGAALEAVLTDPAQRAPFEAQVSADVQQAHSFNLSGVPALIFEQRYLVPGAVPADTLRQIVDQIKGELATK